MTGPTISITGKNGGLLLITDNAGMTHRVPTSNVADVVDSSNDRVSRIGVTHLNGTITLQFGTPEQAAAFLTAIDLLY